MFDLSKPLLAQPELLLALSDPDLIRVVCSLAAILGFFAALLGYAAYPIRRPRSTNPALLLGLALFVTSAVSPVPVGASLLLVGVWACWGAGIMGGTAAAICILHAMALVRKIGSDVSCAYKNLAEFFDDLRDGTVTLGDIGRAAGRAAISATVVVVPMGGLAAYSALVVLLLPEPSPTRCWLFLGGMAVFLVAAALAMQWRRRVLFHNRSGTLRLRSWAD